MSSAIPNAGGAVEDTQGSCMMERRIWDTRLDAATTAGCRRAAWGRVSERFGASGKRCGAEHSTAARNVALGAAKPPRLRREHHQEGKDGKVGVFARWN